MAWPCSYSVKIKIFIFVIFIAQLTFAKAKVISIQIQNKKIIAEVADTEELRQKGLMYRDKLASDHGMLFVFNNEETRSFWMKNCLLDLDIAFLNSKKEIVDIQTMLAPSVLEKNIPSYKSKKPAMYALEMNKGWFARHKIKEGTRLIF